MPDLKRNFNLFLLFTLLIKLAIAFSLPITTDEAYFYIWGLQLDYGYYDHPPMVGWLYWLMLLVSDHTGWMRLPAVLLTTFIGWAIYRVVAQKNLELGILAGILYLIMPINLLGVLISTDTTLIFWSFLSVISFYFALEKNDRRWMFAAGLFLGFAVLSKYFSALLGFAYLIYILIFERNKKGFVSLLIVYGMTIPALLINLSWNYNNCWGNYMFNFVNRHEGDGFNLKTFGGYLLTWTYFLFPPIIYYLYKKRQQIIALRNTSAKVFLIAFFVPILLFLPLSLFKIIGLHWVLSFYPFIFIIMAFVFDKDQFINSIRVVMLVSVLHLIFIGVLIISPYTLIKPETRYHHEVVMGFKPDVFLSSISQHRKQYPHLMTLNYSVAAVMTYHARENVGVIGMGTKRARHDDIVTDYRLLDGENILVFYENDKLFSDLIPMFESVRFETVTIDNATFYLMLGKNFSYKKYHASFLQNIKHWYQIPQFLPRGGCYFYERYFSGEKY